MFQPRKRTGTVRIGTDHRISADSEHIVSATESDFDPGVSLEARL